MKRRKALKWTLIGVGGGVGALVLGGGGTIAYLYGNAKLDTVGEVDFDNPLGIPPLAESETDASGTRVFNLSVRAGATRFKEGGATSTWGVNGDFLGPTIRAGRGEEVAFSVHNGLDEATSIHWHGMHLPAVMDGGPHQWIGPGGEWLPQWTIDQPAATLWYHPHPHGQTGRHVYRGLAGMFIIDDEETGALNLPGEYGVDDVPLIVQDRKFDGGNQFDESASFMSTQGVIGDEILVNGTLGPYFDVTTRLVRLRLLNGSNSRLYNFGFSDDRRFSLIGTDGGLLPEAWETDRLQLSPGERAEVVVAFEPGETVDLRSYPARFGYTGPLARLNGAEDRLDILRFRAPGTLADETEIPAAMGAAPDVDGDEVAEERSFELSGFNSINGEQMDPGRIDFGVREGTAEVWEVTNNDGFMHNFHVHDVQFQVLSVDGQEPPPFLRGWKDTVQLVPQERYRLAMRFTGYTDPNLPYMFHCHILVHEDSGMMGQFVVLGEGERIGTVPEGGVGHGHP
ncbi:multicopper oxidase domain-containing protein [Glycomyces sp. L485]|uniref:multicopper oxidase family protein n=1 Tax=Glycomyces sp. L485 TaxID=2909235 RepID=UPI001F4A9029|nr:multicopper oxidase domain-containing protein [Glycomyces sp. L485]MCH7229612.1 multicopper oxidase domain-containing protein [Glycomyces sp. L485]